MNNQIYVYAYITTYSSNRKTCRLVQDYGDGKLVSEDIDELKAKKLIWEIVLAGGTREMDINYLNHRIVTIGAYIFLPI